MKYKYRTFLLIIIIITATGIVGSAAAQETAPSTGHAYEYVEADDITWQEAREAASERTYNGKQGYLVTITSEEEQEFVQSLTTEHAWIGASDAAQEGTWRWVTGPEGKEDNGQGRHFFTQSGDSGTPVDGQYTNWSSGEPNAANSREDYAQLWGDKATTWNDNNGANAEGYIVEYGGSEEDRDIRTSNVTGHSYEVVETDGVTWDEARELASERTYNGKAGYLATITSREEDRLVETMIDDGAWIGASDANEEGTWRWVTGPEGRENNGNGRHFFTQTSSSTGEQYGGATPGGGDAVAFAFEDWNSDEPNNLDDEDFAQYRTQGNWNDLGENKEVSAYVVEYGHSLPEDFEISITAPSETTPQNSLDVTADVQHVGQARTTTGGGAILSIDGTEVDAISEISKGETVELDGTVTTGSAGTTHTVTVDTPTGSKTQSIVVQEMESEQEVCTGAPKMSRTSITTPQGTISPDSPARVEANFRVDPNVAQNCSVNVDLEYSFSESGFEFGGGSGWEQSAGDIAVTQFEGIQPGEIRNIDAEIRASGASEGEEVTVVADYEIWYEGNRENSRQQTVRETISVEDTVDDRENGGDDTTNDGDDTTNDGDDTTNDGDDTTNDGDDTTDNGDDGGSITVEVPGFGIPTSLVALVSAVYMIRRRQT